MRMLKVAATSLALAVGAGPSTANVRCGYPNPLAPAIAPQEDWIGEFQVTLSVSDYQDGESIQRDLAFAMTWSILLHYEIASRSRGRCIALVMASRFPHLYLFLAHGAGTAKLDAPSCVRLVQKALESKPDARAIERSRADAKRLADYLWTPDFRTAGGMLRQALPLIYRPGTPLQALLSTGPEVFRSIDSDAFAAWLKRQRSAGRMAAMPIRMCSATEPDQTLAHAAFADAASLPHSATVPPGVVTLSPRASQPMEGGQPRHIVAVGAAGPLNAQVIGPARAKYCNREHVFRVEREALKLRIDCRNLMYFNAPWTLFYCESPECASEHVAKSVTQAIAEDPDVAASAGWDPDSGMRLGPYIISVQSVSE